MATESPTDQGERELMLDRQSPFISLRQADEGSWNKPNRRL